MHFRRFDRNRSLSINAERFKSKRQREAHQSQDKIARIVQVKFILGGRCCWTRISRNDILPVMFHARIDIPTRQQGRVVKHAVRC